MRYEKFNQDGSSTVFYTGTLEENKIEAKELVSEWFSSEFQYGTMISSLGFTVDNRRYSDKNDKDNLAGLIKLNIPQAYYKDTNGETHLLTRDQMILLEQEMIADGLGKYQQKWTREAIIDGATTIEEIWV